MSKEYLEDSWGNSVKFAMNLGATHYAHIYDNRVWYYKCVDGLQYVLHDLDWYLCNLKRELKEIKV